MAKTKTPYKDIDRKRTLPKSSQKSHKKPNSSPKRSLEDTIRIRIDDEHLEDTETLDTSFLEGRVQKREYKKKNSTSASKRKALEKKRAEEAEKKRIEEEKRKEAERLARLRNLYYGLGTLCFILLLTLILYNHEIRHKEKPEEPVFSFQEEVGENYLFIGDFHSENIQFDGFEMPKYSVKVMNSSMTTKDLLEDMQKNIYNYNPSVIFIELGLIDLKNGVSEEDLLSQFEDVIVGIREHRPYSKIYVESVFPVNPEMEGYPEEYRGLNNQMIRSFNKKLEKMMKTLNVEYIDMYSALELRGELNDDYSDDGLHLNDYGNRIAWKKIRHIIENDKKK